MKISNKILYFYQKLTEKKYRRYIKILDVMTQNAISNDKLLSDICKIKIVSKKINYDNMNYSTSISSNYILIKNL